MNKNFRQKRLHDYLMSTTQFVSLDYLADMLECSVKTIRREIKEMAEYKPSPWFISDSKVFIDQARKRHLQVDGKWLSDQELVGLLTLNQNLNELSSGALKLLLDPFKHRITDALHLGHQNSAAKVKLIEVAQRKFEPLIFQNLYHSLISQQVIHFQYWKRHSDQMEVRTVSPQQLVRYKDNWYLDAYCHGALDLRSFAVDAIKSLETDASTSYESVEKSQMESHYQSSYGIFSGEAQNLAVLHFDEYISRWIKNETWHPDQKSEIQNDGSLIMQIPYHHDVELIQDILKYGFRVKILYPPKLQEKVKTQLESTLKQYE